MVIKTGFTKWETIYRIGKVFHFHISKRVSAYDAANIVHRVGRCQKLLIGRNVCSEIARMQEGRRADADMNFESAGLFQVSDQTCDRGSSYDRVVHQDDIFSLDGMLQYMKFEPYTFFSFFLCRLYKSTPHIAVFVEG